MHLVVPPEALLSLHVPTPQRETRERWQRVVERHHGQRRALDRRWSSLVGALTRAFDEVHRPPAGRHLRAHEVLQ